MMNGRKESDGLSHRSSIIWLILGTPWEAHLNFFHVGFLPLGIVPNVTFLCFFWPKIVNEKCS